MGRTLILQVWRQSGPGAPGSFQEFKVEDVAPEVFFLDLLDALNERITAAGGEKITYDYACRNGRCGKCALTVDGIPHGPGRGTICRTPVAAFGEAGVLRIEPFRAGPFVPVQDLCTDRSVLDRVVEGGGFVSVKTSGGLISQDTGMYYTKPREDLCIHCGACVAACRNHSAMLFTAGALKRMDALEPDETHTRATRLVSAMDAAGFGACSNFGSCEAVCPTGLTTDLIAELNRVRRSEFVAQLFGKAKKPAAEGDAPQR